MRRRRAQALVALGLVLGGLAPGAQAAASADGPNLAYSKEVSWHLDDVPELAPMEATIRTVLSDVHVPFRVGDRPVVDGFFPGPTYTYDPSTGRAPFYFYIRDTATDLPMVRYYFGASALRSTLEEFLREQYPDGSISGTIGPDLKVDKETVVSDEESSAVIDAAEAFDVMPDPAWLTRDIGGESLVQRLNRAMDWLLIARRDPDTGLIKRGHTTDWGDIKWESGPDPTHMQPGDQWTVSIYDQAIAYSAMQALVRLNTAAGRDKDAASWQAEAADLRSATNRVLWMDDQDRGYYRIHVHLQPDHVRHQIAEDDVVAIGNAAAVYYGLADADKVPRIVGALERARVQAGAPKPGLTLQPPYPAWRQVQMDQHVYQNGALWDWWAGRQISGEFWSGYWGTARDHLLMVARDWATHPGVVHEWESPWIGRTGADPAYAGAAAVVGQSIVEGLFGVDIEGGEVRLTPRLEDSSGGVRVYEPATDLYAAYEYQASERGESIAYGTNSSTALSVRLPVRWRGATQAILDSKDFLPIVYERNGEMLLGRVIVPSGTHTVEMREVPPGRQRF